VHDHCALFTLKFCKAISSKYDENSTYHERGAQKQFKNLIMSVYEENRKMQKAPRETPPPSSPLQM
jgi:hypothetical protein